MDVIEQIASQPGSSQQFQGEECAEMAEKFLNQVFLSYNEADRVFVEALSRRLKGDARLAFWFAPWHSIPGQPIQEQMEEALQQANACAVFIGNAGPLKGWQYEQIRTAIQTRVEDNSNYRVIPVLLPGAARPSKHDLPTFLRRYEPVEFHSFDDEQAFRYLLAGILGLPPIDIEDFLEREVGKVSVLTAPANRFVQGHALVIGIANYLSVRPLPDSVLNDARDVAKLLADPVQCSYPTDNITLLLDAAATGEGMRRAFASLSERTQAEDTAIVFFSGHGAQQTSSDGAQQYLIPYDCNPSNLAGTAITGEQVSELLGTIRAARLLVIFDCCHSGGTGDPKTLLPAIKSSLSDDYYQALAQGKGRVVLASCRPDELSWTLSSMNNSLFTHFLLEALRGHTKTLGDGSIRVFDLFRHVAEQVPARAAQIQQNQHPIFKASVLEQDFAVALAPR